jgi:tetratricopeptide (TPR) repeat protein
LQTGKIALTVVGIIVLAIVGIGGYYMGSSGSRTTVSGDTAGNQSAGAYSQEAVDYSAIVADLKASLAENPDEVELITQLGDAYFEQRNFAEAVNYYKKSLTMKEGDADIYNDLGLSMHYIDNSAEGLKYIEMGILQSPFNQRIWLTKGFLLAYGLGDMNGARAAWEKARALDPESGIGKAAADYLAQIAQINGK